jgi:hypothetical protein
MSINGLRIGRERHSNSKQWYDEILAVIVLVPALIIFIPYATFKYRRKK